MLTLLGLFSLLLTMLAGCGPPAIAGSYSGSTTLTLTCNGQLAQAAGLESMTISDNLEVSLQECPGQIQAQTTNGGITLPKHQCPAVSSDGESATWTITDGLLNLNSDGTLQLYFEGSVTTSGTGTDGTCTGNVAGALDRVPS